MSVVDYFLKVDGIPGESKDSKHKGEIQIESWSLNAHTRGGRGNYKTGKASFDDVRFDALIDASFPKLMLACASGSPVAKAVLTSRKAGGGQQEFMTMTFTDVIVTSVLMASVSNRNSGQGQFPHMQFTLNFAKVQVEYKEQKPDGTVGGPVRATADLRGKNIGS